MGTEGVGGGASVEFDPEAILRLRRFGGDALVLKLAGLFRVSAPGRAEAARRAFRAGDRAVVEREAHSLGSTAGQLGAQRLAERCHEIEDRARAGTLDGVDALLDLLDEEVQNALARLGSLGRGGGPPAKRQIALVDDNADNRLLVRAILGDRYELLDHGTASGALAALQETPVELLLIDISLPEMDGIELLGRLRENPRMARTPAIALTAHAMAGDRERFLAAGFEEHVTKPIVDERNLLGAIERLLGAVT